MLGFILSAKGLALCRALEIYEVLHWCFVRRIEQSKGLEIQKTNKVVRKDEEVTHGHSKQAINFPVSLNLNIKAHKATSPNLRDIQEADRHNATCFVRPLCQKDLLISLYSAPKNAKYHALNGRLGDLDPWPADIFTNQSGKVGSETRMQRHGNLPALGHSSMKPNTSLT